MMPFLKLYCAVFVLYGQNYNLPILVYVRAGDCTFFAFKQKFMSSLNRSLEKKAGPKPAFILKYLLSFLHSSGICAAQIQNPAQ